MKTPLTTLPSDTFIVAAFEELISDTQNLLDAARTSKPLDKAEIAYWRSQRTAYVNGYGDYKAGLLPHATPTGYILRSASHPDQTHRAWQVGGIWTCSCKAGDRGIFHRHTALISALERAAELESLAAPVVEEVTSGPDEAAHVQQLLTARLIATAQIVDAMRAAQGRTARACDPPNEPNPLGDEEGDSEPPDRPRRPWYARASAVRSAYAAL